MSMFSGACFSTVRKKNNWGDNLRWIALHKGKKKLLFFSTIYATELYKNQIQFFVHIGLSFSSPNNPSLRYHPQQLCFSLRTSRPTLSGFITRSQKWWDTVRRGREGQKKKTRSFGYPTTSTRNLISSYIS